MSRLLYMTKRSASTQRLQVEIADGLQMPTDFSFRSNVSSATMKSDAVDLKTSSLKARFFVRSDSTSTARTRAGDDEHNLKSFGLRDAEKDQQQATETTDHAPDTAARASKSMRIPKLAIVASHDGP
mmetsp:Transcript_28974/g.56408  ORF Transcript_28974/g.56408 Transcript_28974/m.56408 type:complete len:127 (-) Transcript_28974:125-505(-)